MNIQRSAVQAAILKHKMHGTAVSLPDRARETSKWAYENKPMTSDFSGRGKNKKTKKKPLHFAHTHKYHPESRNVLNCIIAFIIVFICCDLFLF